MTDLTPGHWRIAPFAPELRLVLERNFWERDEARLDYLLLPSSFWKEQQKLATINGFVLLPSGEPARNAEIRVVRQGSEIRGVFTGRAGATAWSRADGSFSLSADAGALELWASLSGSNHAVPVNVVL